MRITVVSDTHGEHRKLGLLSGDVLIHCGDMFNMFSEAEDEIADIDEWFGRQDFELILCIGGNHDFRLENAPSRSVAVFENAVYLEGESFVHHGLVFHGAPWVPLLSGHAFFRTEDELIRLWADIPLETDVLITHTPALGILDVSRRGLQLGCPHLRDTIERVAPRLHCFGHVHASAGFMEGADTTHINAALVNSRYQLSRAPLIHELSVAD